MDPVVDPQGWAALGVGGILAGIIFFFYRQDRRDERDAAKESMARQEVREQQILSALVENSKAQANLTGVIEGQKENTERLAQAIENQSRVMQSISSEMKSHSDNDERAFKVIARSLGTLARRGWKRR